jgi:hypothetical protein
MSLNFVLSIRICKISVFNKYLRILICSISVFQTIEYPETSKELRYEGDTVSGIPSGNGMMTYRNGDVFHGHFVNGDISGIGKLTYSGNK